MSIYLISRVGRLSRDCRFFVTIDVAFVQVFVNGALSSVTVTVIIYFCIPFSWVITRLDPANVAALVPGRVECVEVQTVCQDKEK